MALEYRICGWYECIVTMMGHTYGEVLVKSFFQRVGVAYHRVDLPLSHQVDDVGLNPHHEEICAPTDSEVSCEYLDLGEADGWDI